MATGLSSHPSFVAPILAGGCCASVVAVYSWLITVIHTGRFFLSPDLEALFHFGRWLWTKLGALLISTSWTVFAAGTVIHTG